MTTLEINGEAFEVDVDGRMPPGHSPRRQPPAFKPLGGVAGQGPASVRTAAYPALLSIGLAVGLATSWSSPAQAQAFNIDFGEPGNAPPHTYAAAGRPGVWNGLVAPNGSTTFNLIDVDGLVTDVSVRQLGGTATITDDDPSTLGDDSLLLDDYLVTFSVPIESCLFFENVEPGLYEVLIYAWMPLEPRVFSFTNIDQEEGNPHYEVGGPWTGSHEELVSYSRHHVEVAADGILNMHSGVSPGADPLLGAALNGVQIRPFAEIFSDGFEGGDTSAWDVAVP